MSENIQVLSVTALTIGTIHTLAGPDHYLPFVALSKARSWTIIKTINIVILCGLGHVLSSVVIGFIGIAMGITISKITLLEGFRGNIAAWLLILFGVAYFLWGSYKLAVKKPKHNHMKNNKEQEKKQITFWVLFAIFVFGPCEPLIPILIYPASEHNYWAVALISLLFALATILTMVVIVLLLVKGISLVKFKIIERYHHLITGLTIAACGAGIIFLGL